MAKPIILSTWSFGVIATRAGWPVLANSGSAIDAVEHACMAVDADLTVDSVGRGGTPDASGQVSLDGSIMLSPARCAGVAYVRRYLHPVSIARQVMERTPHKLLVGDGAEAFAAACGFLQVDLLTEAARERWQRWVKERDPNERDALNRFAQRANREEMQLARDDNEELDGNRDHDTVGVLAIDAGGTLAGACSTSGIAFKFPGRVGDSPIVGHGLYVEPQVGAAVATGRGELMMGICASFLAVERLRLGDTPAEAVRAVVQRVAMGYDLTPADQCALIVLHPSGVWACGSLREGFRAVVTTDEGERTIESQFILRSERP